ncbi:MAG TPA: hypothetical protein VGN17_25495 [Bryobacteraceae bacterium]|jgi:hypothetical protein
MTATELRKQFENMTGEEHAAMKDKLLRLAKAGARKPAKNTIEVYCLKAYTSPPERWFVRLYFEDPSDNYNRCIAKIERELGRKRFRYVDFDGFGHEVDFEIGAQSEAAKVIDDALRTLQHSLIGTKTLGMTEQGLMIEVDSTWRGPSFMRTA